MMPYCLALFKHYQGLMPMAQESCKPIFHLKPADRAIGAPIRECRLRAATVIVLV